MEQEKVYKYSEKQFLEMSSLNLSLSFWFTSDYTLFQILSKCGSPKDMSRNKCCHDGCDPFSPPWLALILFKKVIRNNFSTQMGSSQITAEPVPYLFNATFRTSCLTGYTATFSSFMFWQTIYKTSSHLLLGESSMKRSNLLPRNIVLPGFLFELKKGQKFSCFCSWKIK